MISFLAALFFAMATAQEPPVAPQTAAPSTSGIYIKVGEAAVVRSSMALPGFVYLGTPSAEGKVLGADIFNTLYNDLNVSDYFTFIPQKAFPPDVDKEGLRP